MDSVIICSKLKSKVIFVYAMKVYWAMEVMLPSFVTLAQDAGERSVSHPDCFIPWYIGPGTH